MTDVVMAIAANGVIVCPCVCEANGVGQQGGAPLSRKAVIRHWRVKSFSTLLRLRQEIEKRHSGVFKFLLQNRNSTLSKLIHWNTIYTFKKLPLRKQIVAVRTCETSSQWL
jgi:hypothetical protein